MNEHVKGASLCRGCKAAIVWVETNRGKRMPCDPKPVKIADCKKGDLLIMADGGTLRVGNESTHDEFGLITHWSTCPNANDFRKKDY